MTAPIQDLPPTPAVPDFLQGADPSNAPLADIAPQTPPPKIPITLPYDKIPEAIAQGKFAYDDNEEVPMVDKDGNTVTVKGKYVPQALLADYTLDNDYTRAVREAAKDIGPFQVGAHEAANQVLFGVPNILQKKYGDEFDNDVQAEADRRHATANEIGTGIGAIGNIALGGAVGDLAEGAGLTIKEVPSLFENFEAGNKALQTGGNLALSAAGYESPRAIAEGIAGDPHAAAEHMIAATLLGGVLGGGTSLVGSLLGTGVKKLESLAPGYAESEATKTLSELESAKNAAFAAKNDIPWQGVNAVTPDFEKSWMNAAIQNGDKDWMTDSPKIWQKWMQNLAKAKSQTDFDFAVNELPVALDKEQIISDLLPKDYAAKYFKAQSAAVSAQAEFDNFVSAQAAAKAGQEAQAKPFDWNSLITGKTIGLTALGSAVGIHHPMAWVAAGKLLLSKELIAKAAAFGAKMLDTVPAMLDKMESKTGVSTQNLAGASAAWLSEAESKDKTPTEEVQALKDKLTALVNNQAAMTTRIQQTTDGLHPDLSAPVINVLNTFIGAANGMMPQIPQKNPLTKTVRMLNDTQMGTLNRKLNILMNPYSAIDRLQSGLITAEEVSVLSTVYPKLYQGLKSSVQHSLTVKPRTMPYHSRMKLSMFMGNAGAEPSLQPNAIKAMQTMYTPQQPAQKGISGAKNIKMSNRSADKITPAGKIQ